MTSVSNEQLLAAAFNKILGSGYRIVSKDDTSGMKEVQEAGIPGHVFDFKYSDLQDSIIEVSTPHIIKPVNNRNTRIRVRHLTGKRKELMVNLKGTVQDMKFDIMQEQLCSGVDPDDFRVINEGRQLDPNDLLKDCGIREESTILLVQSLRGGGRCPFHLLNDELLDPEFDYDFSNITDEGKVFSRGGYVYKRPCGWNRIALKVKGKYKNDDWLGTPGNRTASTIGEWPVSYHGSKKISSIRAAKKGYDGDKLERELFGREHYSTPDIEVAAKYATEFQVEGKRYLAVIQNRVNLRTSRIISKELTGAGSDYYVTPSSDDIYPYGVCIKEI